MIRRKRPDDEKRDKKSAPFPDPRDEHSGEPGAQEAAVGELTRLLGDLASAAEDQRNDKAEALYRFVEAELHRMAERHLARERRAQSMQPTLLVNTVCMRLLRQDKIPRNTKSFYGFVSRTMRRVLVDHARKRVRRIPSAPQSSTMPDMPAAPFDFHDDAAYIVAADQAVDWLDGRDGEAASVFTLRYFVDCKVAEIAQILGLEIDRVRRKLTLSKAWISRYVMEQWVG